MDMYKGNIGNTRVRLPPAPPNCNMKIHLVYIIYIVTILCGGGWYIHEQKATISEQDTTIQELTVNQRPPILPEKRKIKIVDKIVDKIVKVKDEQCIKDYNTLHQKTLQCAYNLKFCQEASDVYSRLKPKEEK